MTRHDGVRTALAIDPTSAVLPTKRAAPRRPCNLLPWRSQTNARRLAPGEIPTVDFLLQDFGRAGKFCAVKSHVGAVPESMPWTSRPARGPVFRPPRSAGSGRY